MFGGIPEGTGYRFAYAPHQFMQPEGSYPRRAPRPPSPSLQAQRLIREQQVCLLRSNEQQKCYVLAIINCGLINAG